MSFSSQHHSFDISLASQYGIEEAILIHHFQHWIRINQYKKKNIREGRCWTYQSRKDIEAHFPYWNYDRIRRLCESLVAAGVLTTANYNKNKIDKTLWYAFLDEKKFGVDPENSNNFYERQNCPSSGKSATWKGKSATPIPDTIPNTKTDIVCYRTPKGADEESKNSVKEENLKMALEALKLPLKISKKTPDNKEQEVSLSELFSLSIQSRKNWTTKEIHDAWKILCDYTGAIRDPFRFIEGTIEKLRNKNRSDFLAKGKKCTPQKNQSQKPSAESKESSLGKDTNPQISLASLLAKEGLL